MTPTPTRHVEFDGELTIVTAAERYQLLCSALASASQIGLDLSRVTEFDTAGLQLLLLARREATLRGATVTLLDPSEAVRAGLSIVHLGADRELDAGPFLNQEA